MVNFSMSFYGGNIEDTLEFVGFLTILYIFAALGFLFWYFKKEKATLKLS